MYRYRKSGAFPGKPPCPSQMCPEHSQAVQRILDLPGLWIISRHHHSAGPTASCSTAVLSACEIDWKGGSQGKGTRVAFVVTSLGADNKQCVLLVIAAC